MTRMRIDDKHYLEITVSCRDSFYTIYFATYTRIDDDGLVETCPFDEGNFVIRLGQGRKSAKKLAIISSWIEENLLEIFLKWNKKNYKEIADSCMAFWRTL